MYVLTFALRDEMFANVLSFLCLKAGLCFGFADVLVWCLGVFYRFAHMSIRLLELLACRLAGKSHSVSVSAVSLCRS